MTPTLLGRWQTRILLYLVFGLPITLIYAFFLSDSLLPLVEPFVFITALLILGLILDFPYIQIQRFRWDNDWPFAFQLFFSILEFFITFGLMQLGLFDFLLDFRIPFSTALIHFTLVLIPSFLALLGGMQLFLIRWRFKGGEIGRHPVQ